MKFEYAGMTWGGEKAEFGKEASISEKKTSATTRSKTVSEKVEATGKGFENTVTISEPGGEGDLKLEGSITTGLKIEETFLREEGAETFTNPGDTVFLDGADNRVLLIRATIAKDAAGAELTCPVTYTKTSTGLDFAVQVPEKWLASAKYPIQIDPLIGSPATATANGLNDYSCGIAFGSSKYLLVYTAPGSFPSWNIYGRFLNADGTLSGSQFLILSGATSTASPRVAYVSGSSGVFGVSYCASPWVYLKRFNASGTLLSTTQIASATAAQGAQVNSITSNGTDRFCITWPGFAVGPNIVQIYAELRDSAGALIKDDTVVASASGVTDLDRPDVVWNATSSHWFFSYESYDGSVSGSAHTVKGTSWNAGLTTNSVTPFTISSIIAGESATNSANTWNSVNNEYLVAWTKSTASDGLVRFRRVRGTDGVLQGSETSAETGSNASFMGDVAYSATSNRFVVTFQYAVWGGGTGGIYGQVILNDGTLWQGMFTVNDDAAFLEYNPTLGTNAGSDEFVVNWTDAATVGGEQDVWYVRLDITPPPVPTGLAGTSGDTVVNLSWTAVSAPDLSGYNAYARVVGSPTWIKKNVSTITGTTYTVTGLVNGTDYELTVASLDTRANESAKATLIVVRPKDLTIPATPSGLSAIGGNHVVNLSWTANTEADLAGYNVYRSLTSGGSYTKINLSLIAAPTHTYSDTTVTNRTPYFYKVTALDISTNESPQSAYVTATPTYPIPTALTFDSSTYNSITFHWSYFGSGDLVGFKVYRSATSGSGYASLTPSPISPTTFTDSGLSSGTYYYVVTAVGPLSDESLYSVELPASTTSVPPPTLDSANTRKTNDQTPAITGTSTAGWTVTLYEGVTVLGSGTVDGTGHFNISTTATLLEGSHVIQGKATVPIAGSPTSGYSSGVVVTIDITPPPAPTDVNVTSGDSWIEVRWSGVEASDLLGYNVYRRATGTTPWTKLNDKPLTQTKYLNKGGANAPVNGNSYEFKVTAVDDSLTN
ncbi:MAG: fibronectin type III domain-containing protein [Planctomycetes bacterium]|nr:fibronectin type III domain-containing protein [Planctomycetota bacterium]